MPCWPSPNATPWRNGTSSTLDRWRRNDHTLLGWNRSSLSSSAAVADEDGDGDRLRDVARATWWGVS